MLLCHCGTWWLLPSPVTRQVRWAYCASGAHTDQLTLTFSHPIELSTVFIPNNQQLEQEAQLLEATTNNLLLNTSKRIRHRDYTSSPHHTSFTISSPTFQYRSHMEFELQNQKRLAETFLSRTTQQIQSEHSETSFNTWSIKGVVGLNHGSSWLDKSSSGQVITSGRKSKNSLNCHIKVNN